MKQKIKLLLYGIVNRAHYAIFGVPMSPKMNEFLRNMSWSFYAGIIVVPLTMLVSTLAGRYMGPTEFGKYNLAVIISSYLMIFTFFGLDIATIKYLVKAKSLDERKKIFSSSALFVFSILIIYFFIVLLFGNKISAKFSLPNGVLAFTIVFTIGAAIKSLTDLLGRGLEKFKVQAKAKIIEVAVLIIVLTAIAYVYKNLNFQIYIISLSIAALSLSVYYGINLRKYFSWISWRKLRELLSEGRYFMICALLGTLFYSADRLLITKYLGLNSLGIYSAYYAGSITIMATLVILFTNVLLPATAKIADKFFVLKMNRLLVTGFVPVYLFAATVLSVFVLLFGKSYPLRLDYVLLFSLIATLYFFGSLYNVIILDAQRHHYVKYITVINLVNLLTIAYYVIFMVSGGRSIDLILVGFACNLFINLIIQRRFALNMQKLRSDI